MTYKPSWYSNYRKIAETLNKCGITNLRKYCTTKKRPVKDFDRDIRLVQYCLRYGPDACVPKFGISKQRAHQVINKYLQYAEECISRGEDEA